METIREGYDALKKTMTDISEDSEQAQRSNRMLEHVGGGRWRICHQAPADKRWARWKQNAIKGTQVYVRQDAISQRKTINDACWPAIIANVQDRKETGTICSVRKSQATWLNTTRTS